ncbi:flagellar export chaperone FliS [Alteromonas sp. 5E99-2]|uniref:flagellar export chaperone FliS n=1 Tax=Alteromonas sp. 5E99-2 TaxID=2817683 RepID=UPI001A980E38|nr:flagellar export chaperone FliS [Alteromonas sp. 5E99-2]MBO1255252.1 flagellar export chaperone FliS [Alteromonas sp. 5E99-2]
MRLTGINAYKKGNLKQDIANADPHRLTLMLMQGALDRLAYAKGAIERKEFESKSELLSRVTAIFMNLRDTIDLEVGGELSQNLYSLYDYMIDQIGKAHIENSLEPIDEVIHLFSPIRDAWVQIPQSAKDDAYQMKLQNNEVV